MSWKSQERSRSLTNAVEPISGQNAPSTGRREIAPDIHLAEKVGLGLIGVLSHHMLMLFRVPRLVDFPPISLGCGILSEGCLKVKNSLCVSWHISGQLLATPSSPFSPHPGPHQRCAKVSILLPADKVTFQVLCIQLLICILYDT